MRDAGMGISWEDEGGYDGCAGVFGGNGRNGCWGGI